MQATEAVKDLIDSSDLIKRSEMVDIIREHDPYISQSNINWIIHDILAKSGVTRVGKGIYQKTGKIAFRPEFSLLTNEVAEFIASRLPGITSAVWDTRILNRFAEHMLFNSFVIVEVEKDLTETVFEALQEKYDDVFIEPSEDILWRYAKKPEVIVIKKLISQSPLQKFNRIKTISAEKLIVDLHSKDAALAAVRGNETLNIVRSILQMHVIQFDRMMRYAGRRGLKSEVSQTFFELAKYHNYKL